MFLASALLACSGAPTDTADTASPDCAPAMTLDAPLDGSTVCSTAFEVQLTITGLTLVDPYTPPDPLPACSGHVDVTLNGVDVEMTGGESTVVTSAADGFEYRLQAELSNADHTPMDPYVGEYVFITAALSACDP